MPWVPDATLNSNGVRSLIGPSRLRKELIVSRHGTGRSIIHRNRPCSEATFLEISSRRLRRSLVYSKLEMALVILAEYDSLVGSAAETVATSIGWKRSAAACKRVCWSWPCGVASTVAMSMPFRRPEGEGEDGSGGDSLLLPSPQHQM